MSHWLKVAIHSFTEGFVLSKFDLSGIEKRVLPSGICLMSAITEKTLLTPKALEIELKRISPVIHH
jgi:hypothetical protein